MRNLRNSTKHGVSLLTWISDAGSTPAASTIFNLEPVAVEVLRYAQDFACGLRRPQRGSSSTPAASTNKSFMTNNLSNQTAAYSLPFLSKLLISWDLLSINASTGEVEFTMVSAVPRREAYACNNRSLLGLEPLSA